MFANMGYWRDMCGKWISLTLYIKLGKNTADIDNKKGGLIQYISGYVDVFQWP